MQVERVLKCGQCFWKCSIALVLHGALNVGNTKKYSPVGISEGAVTHSSVLESPTCHYPSLTLFALFAHNFLRIENDPRGWVAEEVVCIDVSSYHYYIF